MPSRFPRRSLLTDTAAYHRHALPLYPLRIDVPALTDSQEFRDSLYRHFLTYDVWAVVAATTAGNTPGLLRALDFIDVPILLTLDSASTKTDRFNTAVPSAGQRGMNTIDRPPNVLRLIPNNEQQAQAIVNKTKDLIESRTRGPTTRRPLFCPAQVFLHPVGDRYVMDLREAIDAQSKAGPRQPHFGFKHDVNTVSREGIIVVVGYEAAFDILIEHGYGARAHLLLSDGCYDNAHVVAIQRRMKHSDMYWAHSAFEPASYARDAYKAVCDEWKDIGCQASLPIERGLAPSQRVTPLVRLLAERLHKINKAAYQFDGLDNQRGGFVVDPVPRQLSSIHSRHRSTSKT